MLDGSLMGSVEVLLDARARDLILQFLQLDDITPKADVATILPPHSRWFDNLTQSE